MFIPDNLQTILQPSIFVVEGTLPIIFTIYGILLYGILASLFLFLGKNLTGKKIMQGLKYGGACSLIWFMFLLEPLPHTVPIDTIAYLIADLICLLVLGLLVGYFLDKQ